MRRTLFAALALTLAACSGEAPTESALASAPNLPRHDASGSTITVLPTTTFVRRTGTPRTDAVSFSVPGGVTTTLHLSSASPQGLNATVTINGETIFNSIDGESLPIDLDLTADSEYSIAVRLTGRPGSSVTLSATIPMPAARSILFTSDRETPGVHQIYSMAEDGENVARLSFSGANDFEPRWSPDRSKIVFSSDRLGTRQIFIMDADGDNVIQCTSTGFNGGPDWSPNGQQIAFYSRRDGLNQIYVMNGDCSGQNRISNGTTIDYGPAWAPDGSQLAFVLQTAFTVQDIWVMNPDGTGRTPLTAGTGINYTPRWSPDGSHIAFTSSRSGGQNVWQMTSTGLAQTQLTSSATSYVPVYSPDGSRILFASNRTGIYQVYDLTLSSMSVRQLSSPTSGESYGPDIR